MKTHKKMLIATGVAAAAILLFLLLRNTSVEDILSFTPDNPILAAGVLLLIYCLKNVLMFIPIVVLFLAAGVLFPTGWAVAVTYLCLLCELSIGYYIGHRAGMGKIRPLIERRPKAGAFLDMVDRNHATACFLTRLIPMPVPIDLMSMFYGAIGTPYIKYITFSLLGLSGFMIPSVVAGDAISTPLSPQFSVPFAIALGVTGGAFVVYLIVEKRRKAKKNEGDGR